MAIVQSKSQVRGQNTTQFITFDSNVTAGSIIVVGIGISAGATAVTSFSPDSLGNNMNEGNLSMPSNGNCSIQIFWGYAGTGGACTVTLGLTQSVPCTLFGYELSGRASSPVDVNPTNSHVGDGNLHAPTLTVVTTIAGDDIIAMMATGYPILPTSMDSPFTGLMAGNSWVYEASGHALNQAAGTYVANFNPATNTGHWATVAMAFAPSSSPPPSGGGSAKRLVNGDPLKALVGGGLVG